MTPSAPTLLVWEPDARIRLRALAALRGVVTLVVAEDPDESPLRLVRRLRPDTLLLALGRGRLAPGLALCQRICTDAGRVPRIGLTDRWSRLRDPAAALATCGAEGYLGGVADDAALVAFVGELNAGRKPVLLHPPEPGLLGRLLGR